MVTLGNSQLEIQNSNGYRRKKMSTKNYFDEGNEPLIRVISASKKVWYRNNIGEKFHATSFDVADGGWYSIKEHPDKDIKASDVEIGDAIGKTDLTEEIEKQKKRIAEEQVQKQKDQEMMHAMATEIEETPVQPIVNQVQHTITEKPNHPPFVRPRMEYDWDSDKIQEDLFVSYTDTNGDTHKGLVKYVEPDVIVMNDKSGKEHHIYIKTYIEGRIKVNFPEL